MTAFFVVFVIVHVLADIGYLWSLASSDYPRASVATARGDVLGLLVTTGMMVWGIFVWKSL